MRGIILERRLVACALISGWVNFIRYAALTLERDNHVCDASNVSVVSEIANATFVPPVPNVTFVVMC